MKDNEYWNPMVPELLVTDFSKSLKFYTEMLGFNVLYTREEPYFAYLDHEKVQIMIEQLEEGSWITGDTEYPLGRGINLQIELTDIEPIYKKLISEGYALYRDMKESWYETGKSQSGQREFLVQDPADYNDSDRDNFRRPFFPSPKLLDHFPWLSRA